MYTRNDFIAMSDTIWGEARGESFLGKEAVGQVILNRAKKHNMTISEVCHQPWQFSCWNASDPNRTLLINPNMDISQQKYFDCIWASYEVLSGASPDLTKGATHYHTQDMETFPAWTQGKSPCYVEGRHLFYNNID
jgi:N-acetylmuramoyl-L-alanine amidase